MQYLDRLIMNELKAMDAFSTDQFNYFLKNTFSENEGLFLRPNEIKHADNRNYALMQELGWEKHIDAIADYLSLEGYLSPNYTNQEFIEAISQWQARQDLGIDGIIGKRTWCLLGNKLIQEGFINSNEKIYCNGSKSAHSKTATQIKHETTPYFKDNPELQTIPLKPANLISIDPHWTSLRRNLAATYNRIGGLIQTLANQVGVEIATVLAIWQIESAGKTHIPGRAIIRFENHLFYKVWGKVPQNRDVYDRHFRHGGHNGQPGKSWENHQFREGIHVAFRSFHPDQSLEYRVLSFARQLAGDLAFQAISIGGSQILIANYRRIGYSSARAMYDAFQANERAHVLGFFDFCQQHSHGNLFQYLRKYQWFQFAYYYNGSGKANTYGSKIEQAYNEGLKLPI